MELTPNRESVRDFIHIAVHDLREPLRAIRAGSELLAAKCAHPGDENITRNLRYVQDGVDRLESLIRSVSEFCYEEVRQLNKEPVSLNNALIEAQRELSAELKTCGAMVSHDPLPMVTGDALALALLFRCLLDNSCKFRGDAPPRIQVKAAETAHELTISVGDNGMGFKAEYCERVFKPFERLNGKRYPGSGLGLAMAQRIVERHGGRIWADSTLGEGTTVSFALPIGG